MIVDPDRCWQPRAGVAFVDSPDRVALLDLSRPAAAPQILEGPAAEIWRLLDGTHSAAEVATAVAEAFDADVAGVRPDVDEFLSSLADRGLIEAR